MRKSPCSQFRDFCRQHEWAQSLFASLGVAVLAGVIWFVLEAYSLIISWISADVLIHGLLFALAMLGVLMVGFVALMLGFAECAEEDRNCLFAYRGRRSGVHPGTLGWLESLGSNPRRRSSDYPA